ncbi:hypothetical protein EDC04DRAFT_2930685 [Pisolithus marmoratus]|nr:hypothetical protein EDC04DRAFT_2930685 [Pisolithus marmoratus]
MKLEVRAIGAKMAETTEAPPDLPQVERRPTAPDKGRTGTSRFDDAIRKDLADSQRVEKAMLTSSSSQYGKREVKQQNGLPAPPESRPAGITLSPQLYRAPIVVEEPKWMLNASAALGGSGIHTGVMPSPCQHFHSPRCPWNGSNLLWGCPRCQEYATTTSGAPETLKRKATRTYWTNYRNDGTTSSEFSDSHGVEKALLANSSSQYSECEPERSNGSPASPKPPPNGLAHIHGTLGDPCRRARIKTKPENGVPPGSAPIIDKRSTVKTAASRLWYKAGARTLHNDFRNGKLPQRGAANTATQRSQYYSLSTALFYRS